MQFLGELWKMSENLDVKLGTSDRRRNYLVPETNYHITKKFYKEFVSKRTKKNTDTHNKPVYLVLSILEINKIEMNKFWYDYIKPKYGQKSKITVHGYRQL